MFIILGLIAICLEKASYIKHVKISLILFLVQVVYLFFEYVIFASIA
ncbi:MAG: hypothetical protein Q6373_015285 [Candidatus Sigynarchaeota archaeon]